MKPKILHVAVFSSQSNNICQADAFENIGCQVRRFDYRSNKNHKEVLEICENWQPDLVLYSKCNNFDNNILRQVKTKQAIWYMDHANNVDQELMEKFELADAVFCSRMDGIRAASKVNSNVHRLNETFNPTCDIPMDLPLTRDASFIGDLRNDRKRYSNVVEFDHVSGVYGLNHTKVANETAVNLNFTEGDGTSDRLFKIMATGGFVLTQPWERIGEDFVYTNGGKELDVFESPKELQEKINYYLKYPQERKQIAMRGFMAVVNRFNPKKWARTILEHTIEKQPDGFGDQKKRTPRCR